MKRVEDILALCIEDIRAGRKTLEDCLEQYPDARHELEPLLRLAVNIPGAPDVEPAADFVAGARARLMSSIRGEQQKKQNRLASAFTGVLRSPVWVRAALAVLAVIIVLSASGTGVAYASQKSLPGEILYPVKIGVEQVRRMLAFDDGARIELELELSEKRLGEMESLAEKDPVRIALAVDGYEDNIQSAVGLADSPGKDGRHFGYQENVARKASAHIGILDGIGDKTPSTEKESVQRASTVAVQTQLRALSAMAETDPVTVLEINAENMQNRLRRASTATESGDIPAADAALQQCEQMRVFGEQVAGNARQHGQDTLAIDEIHQQVEAGENRIRNRMHGESPAGTTIPTEENEEVPLEENVGNSPGKSAEGPDTTAGTDNRTPEDNIQQEKPGSPPEDSGDPPQTPENPPQQPGSPPEEPGNPPQGPGSPPENPGGGSGGQGNGKK